MRVVYLETGAAVLAALHLGPQPLGVEGALHGERGARSPGPDLVQPVIPRAARQRVVHVHTVCMKTFHIIAMTSLKAFLDFVCCCVQNKKTRSSVS